MDTDLFEAALSNWLEAHGVVFTGFDEIPLAIPFKATIDLNELKVGMVQLIQAYVDREARIHAESN